MLWFDVKIEEYTTLSIKGMMFSMLWFDVKIEEYTTTLRDEASAERCGLM